MARVAYRGGRPQRLVAETGDERALVAHGREEGGGRVVLEEAYYLIDGDALLLPENASAAAAIDLAAVFAEAARRHREARVRRASFRVV